MIIIVDYPRASRRPAVVNCYSTCHHHQSQMMVVASKMVGAKCKRMRRIIIVSTISILVCSMRKVSSSLKQTRHGRVSQTRCGWVYQPRNPVGNAYRARLRRRLSWAKKCRQATKRASVYKRTLRTCSVQAPRWRWKRCIRCANFRWLSGGAKSPSREVGIDLGLLADTPGSV